MFLAFQLSDIITVPFGYLLSFLYQLTGNYGVAMILFAVLVQVVLMPINAKSKKSMMKMSRLTPRVQEIQSRYANDPQKQNELIQKLYRDEGASMGGGCLWSLIPLLILWPLLAVVRQPITYILMESADVAQQIVSVIKDAAPSMFSSNSYYDQVIAAQAIPQFVEELKAACPPNVTAIHESPSFEQLATYIAQARFVLVPYHTASVLSSGILMDSLSYGAQIIGPRAGSFDDYAVESALHVYTFDSFDDIPALVTTHHDDSIDYETYARFLNEHNWPHFVQRITRLLSDKS